MRRVPERTRRLSRLWSCLAATKGAGGRCLKPGEIVDRIDGLRALAQFEMKLRRRDISGLAGFGDDLPALDGLAALHIDLGIIRIGRNEAIGVADQNEIAIAFELIAGIGDDARLGRFHRRAFRQRDVYAVIAGKAANDPAARRPAEFGRSGRHRSLVALHMSGCRRRRIDRGLFRLGREIPTR